MTRLFLDQDLGDGDAIELADERAHYLRHVLRLEPGARIDLFNGRGGEWRSRLDAVGKGYATLIVEQQLRPQTPEPDLWLCFAPIKRARIDTIAEKATELGVALLQPVLTRHTAVERVNVERLRANAIEAAEQTERLTVPDIRSPVELMKLLGDWPADRRLLMADE